MKDYSHIATKEEAFALARKELGIKKTFKYQGVTYRTDTLEDEASSLWELIPLDDDNKYKIEHNKNQIFQWMDGDWQLTKILDGKIIPVNNVDGYKYAQNKVEIPIKYDGAKVTKRDILLSIVNDPEMHDIFKNIIEIFNSGNEKYAWKRLISMEEGKVYEHMVTGDTNDVEGELITRGLTLDKNDSPIYDSFNPFMWNSTVEMDGFEEFALSEGVFKDTKGINGRESGIYYLIQMMDETGDPTDPQILLEPVDDEKALNLMLSMPNNKIDAQSMGLGDEWDKVQELYDKGYRLLSENGEIQRGYKEEASWLDIFTINTARQEWTVDQAFREDIEKNGWVNLLPFGSWKNVAELYKIYESAQRIINADETGDWSEVSDTDLMLLKTHYEKSLRDPDWWTMVYEGAVQIPGFAIEILLTRGITSTGVKLTKKGIQKGLMFMSKKRGRDIIENKLVNFGVSLTSHLVTNAFTRTANPITGMGSRTVSGAVERQIPLIAVGYNDHGDLKAMILQEGMGITQAWGWSFIDTHIEVMSEQFGEWVMGLTPGAKEVVARMSFIKLFEKLNPNLSQKQLTQLMNKYGFQGVGMEMIEEEVGRGVRGVFHFASDGADPSFEYKLPTWKELSATFTSFLLNPMSHGITGYNYLANYQNIVMADRVKEYSRRGSDYYQPGFNKRASVKQVNKAIKNGSIDVNAGNYIKYILANNKDFDAKAIIEIFKKGEFIYRETWIKKLMEEGGLSYKVAEKRWMDFLKGEGETEDALIVQVLGSTTVIDIGDGMDRVVMSIYAGATKETIVEEFLGVYFKTMNATEMKEFMKVYDASGSEKTPQEFFEKNGIGYILDKTEFGNTTMMKIMNGIKKQILKFLGMANSEYEIPDNVKNMYDNLLGEKDGSKEIEVDTGETVEVKNVNINSNDKSYHIVPVKEVAINLANKSILNPENIQDKQLRNKVVNRGVLRGFREIREMILSGEINVDEAKGWYNDEVNDTFDIMTEEIPELENNEALQIFAKSVLAITSNGQKVRTNYNQAVELVKDYLENGSFTQDIHVTDEYVNRVKTGNFLEKPAMFTTDVYGEKRLVGGTRFTQIRNSLMMVEGLIDKYGMDGAMRFLLEKQLGSVIASEVGQGTLTKTGMHYGAERFGKKVGAFFLNLNGISELPTYDQWWSRTYNRWMGTPLSRGGELVESPRSPSEIKVMTEILYRLSDKLTNDSNLNPSGEKINPEDVQALLWYMEKDLYIKAGATPSELISFKTVAEERRSLINERNKSTSSESLQEPIQTKEVGDTRPGQEGTTSTDVEGGVGGTREVDRTKPSYQIKAFHGTDIPTIDQFDPYSKAKTGRIQGFGTYFADEKALSTHYAKQTYENNKNKNELNPDGSPKYQPTVYTVVVHKGKTPDQYDYLVWEDSPTQKQEQKIMTQASIEFSEQEQEQLLNLYLSKITGNPQTYETLQHFPKVNMSTVHNSNSGVWVNQDIYDAIATIFAKRILEEGRKVTRDVIYNEVFAKASMFMLDAGIDGMKYQSGLSPTGVKGQTGGIVVYNADEIDIQKKESFHIRTIKTRLELKPETLKDWLYQKIVDKYHRMKIVQQSFPVVGEDVDVYLKMIQHPGKTKYKLEQVEKQLEKIMIRVEKAGFTMQEFENYLYALHVHSRNKVIRERTNGENDAGSGMTDKEANDILDKYQGSKMDNIVKTFHKQVTQKRLDLLLKHGFITKKEYDAYYKQWDNYVPLKSDTLLNRFFQNVRSGFNVQGKDVHRAGGRTSRARNVVFQSVADLQETIRRVEQNEVLKTVAKLIRKNPSDLWKIKRPKTHKKTRLWDTDGNYEIFGQDELAHNEIGFVEIDKGGNRRQMVIEINDESSVIKDDFGRVKRNPLLTTLTNIGVEKGFNILNKINNHLRRVYTTYNPDFIVSNFERDLQTAFYNLNTDYDPKTAMLIMNDVRKALVGIYKNVRGYKKAGLFGNEWKNLYEDYKRNGGQMGWFDSKSIDEKIAEIERKIRRSAKGGNTRKAISYMAQYIEHLNETVESAVRLATYKRMIMNGMSKRKAVAVAKDLTINFNRKGEWGSMINSAYLFFNAGVQGAVNVGSRAFGTNTGRGIMTSLFGLGMLNSYLNKTICPDYDEKISGYEKDNYMVFMKPNCKIGFKLRMPYGWGMFKAIGGISYDYMDGTIGLTEATTRVFSSADHSFNPMGGGTISQALAPTIVDPLIMVGEGKDFKGDDLYPKEYSPNLTPDYTKHKKYTSDLYVNGAKWVAEGTGIDISPETYKVWTNFLGGGALSNIQNSFITGSSLISEGRLPRVRNDDNTINWSVIPIFRQHVTQPKDWLVANKVWDMLRSADITLHDVNEFKYTLQQAVRNGTITSEKAYGKYGWDSDNDGWVDTGTAGIQFQFIKRQQTLRQKGGRY